MGPTEHPTIPKLTPEERQQALAALDRLRRHAAELLRHQG